MVCPFSTHALVEHTSCRVMEYHVGQLRIAHPLSTHRSGSGIQTDTLVSLNARTFLAGKGECTARFSSENVCGGADTRLCVDHIHLSPPCLLRISSLFRCPAFFLNRRFFISIRGHERSCYSSTMNLRPAVYCIFISFRQPFSKHSHFFCRPIPLPAPMRRSYTPVFPPCRFPIRLLFS